MAQSDFTPTDHGTGKWVDSKQMAHSQSEPFDIYWQDDNRSIIVIDFPEAWTMDEVFVALDRMAAMMDEGAEKQAAVFDLSGSTLPPDSPQHFREILSTAVIEHRALNVVVTVTDGRRPVMVMVSIFNRLHVLFHNFPILEAHTLPEAFELVERYWRENTPNN